MGWSLSKMVRIETGDVRISTSDLKSLLAFYRLRDPDRAAMLARLARAARQTDWTSKYRTAVPDQVREFAGYEHDATRLWQYHPLLVPELAQTRAYAQALLHGLAQRPAGQLNARLGFQTARQRQVLELAGAQRQILVDETALHRIVGGPTVMSEQLTHLIRLATAGPVELIVVPATAGAHPGLAFGACTLLTTGATPDHACPDLALLDNPPAPQIIDSYDNDLAGHHAAFTALIAYGVAGGEAITALTAARERLQR